MSKQMRKDEPFAYIKDVVGYEGSYQITKDGEVWSNRSKKYLRTIKHSNGYCVVSLGKNGKIKQHRVHRLVARAFHPNPEKKPHVNHIDGDKTNNMYLNLEWCTEAENVQHAFRTGLAICSQGQNSHKAKLSNSIVSNIKARYANGEQQKTIALGYGINPSTISRIITKQTWRHHV